MNNLEKQQLKIALKEDFDFTNDEIKCLFKFNEFFEDSYFTSKYFKAEIGINNGKYFDIIFRLYFDDKHFRISLRDDNEKEITICDDYLENMDFQTIKFITNRLRNILNNLYEINI